MQLTYIRAIGMLLFSIFFSCPVFAQKVINVYVWGGELPASVIAQFEKQTNIKVNFSTYDSNETMYAKLRTAQDGIYDVILPSTYYVERMQKQGMLTPLNLKNIPNIKHIKAFFIKNSHIQQRLYAVPFIWGTTGIVSNKKYVKQSPRSWKALFATSPLHSLMLLDDPREIFSIALMSLGYKPSDTDPEHINKAYQKILSLVTRIKLFASDGIQALLIDGDAFIGTAWNGDAFKAYAENSSIDFVYPQEGFILWIDCLAIPIHAPHLKEAYTFINFLLNYLVSIVF